MQLSRKAGKCLKTKISAILHGANSDMQDQTTHIHVRNQRFAILFEPASFWSDCPRPKLPVKPVKENTDTTQVAACSLSSCPTFW